MCRYQKGGGTDFLLCLPIGNVIVNITNFMDRENLAYNHSSAFTVHNRLYLDYLKLARFALYTTEAH